MKEGKRGTAGGVWGVTVVTVTPRPLPQDLTLHVSSVPPSPSFCHPLRGPRKIVVEYHLDYVTLK